MITRTSGFDNLTDTEQHYANVLLAALEKLPSTLKISIDKSWAIDEHAGKVCFQIISTCDDNLIVAQVHRNDLIFNEEFLNAEGC